MTNSHIGYVTTRLSDLLDAPLSNNTADFDDDNTGDGGGIYNQGTLNVYNSTISGNDANDSGGIGNDTGTATIINSTISGSDHFEFVQRDHCQQYSRWERRRHQ